MKVYLDLIILMNLLFNGMILILVNYLLRYKLHRMRLIFATIFATLYIPLYMYIPHPAIHSIIGKIVYSCFIMIIAFQWMNIRHFFKTFALFYFISFVIGGGLFSIHYLLQSNSTGNWQKYLLYVYNVEGDKISLLILFGCFPILIYFIKKLMDYRVMDQFRHDQGVDLSVTWNKQTYETKGFVDTGNYLVDPIFKRPVVICNTQFMKQFFSKNDWPQIEQAIILCDPTLLPDEVKHDFTFIPYEGVNGSNDVLFAIKPTRLTVKESSKRIETKRVWIAIRSGQFTSEHRYDCLLHPEILYMNPIQWSS